MSCVGPSAFGWPPKLDDNYREIRTVLVVGGQTRPHGYWPQRLGELFVEIDMPVAATVLIQSADARIFPQVVFGHLGLGVGDSPPDGVPRGV